MTAEVAAERPPDSIPAAASRDRPVGDPPNRTNVSRHGILYTCHEGLHYSSRITPPAAPGNSRGRGAHFRGSPICHDPRARPPAPPDPAAALTPGQGAWLAVLTTAERARFDALPERSRARFLEWHQAGVNTDPILAGEAARVLRPRVRSAPGSSPGEPFALTGEPAYPRRSPER